MLEIETDAGTRTVHRVASTGGSFGANALRLEIGLGAGARITSLEIQWPGSGTIDRLRPVEVNRAYSIIEGSGRAEAIDRPTITLGG